MHLFRVWLPVQFFASVSMAAIAAMRKGFMVKRILFLTLWWCTWVHSATTQTRIKDLPSSSDTLSTSKFPIDDSTYGVRGITIQNLATALTSYGVVGSTASDRIRVFENVAALESATGIQEGTVGMTRGYTTAQDGGHAFYVFDAGGAQAVDSGAVVTNSSGRWLTLELTGPINVLQWGVKRDGVTDSKTRIEAAYTYASANSRDLFFPKGTYEISSLTLNGSPGIHGEGGWLYEPHTIFRHASGATGDLITSGASYYRPTIRNIYFKGRREQNLRNPRTISSVTSRTQFAVDSSPPAGITGTAASLVFIYTPADGGGYRYLGYGQINTIVGNTVTLYTGTDNYQGLNSAVGLLTAGCVVTFPELITETAPFVDFTRAGYSAINVNGLGAYLNIEQCRFEQWHTCIRRGYAIAVKARDLFFGGFSLGAIVNPTGSGSDDVYHSIDINGVYSTQGDLPAQTVALYGEDSTSLFRKSAFGLYLGGTANSVEECKVYHCVNNLVCDFNRAAMLDHITLDASVLEGAIFRNNSKVNIGNILVRGSGFYNSKTYTGISVSDSLVTIGSISAPGDISPVSKSAIKVSGTSRVNVSAVSDVTGVVQFDDPVNSVEVPVSKRDLNQIRDGFKIAPTSQTYFGNFRQAITSGIVSNRWLEASSGAVTASQSGTTVTTSADIFGSGDVGKLIVWGSGVGTSYAFITARSGSNSVTVVPSQTVSSGAFTLLTGLQIARYSHNSDGFGVLVSVGVSGSQNAGALSEWYSSVNAYSPSQTQWGANRLLVFDHRDPLGRGDAQGQRIHDVYLFYLTSDATTLCQFSANISALFSRSATMTPVTTVTVSLSSGTLTASSSYFGPADVGRFVRIDPPFSSSGYQSSVYGMIKTYTSGTSVELDTTGTITGGTITFLENELLAKPQ